MVDKQKLAMKYVQENNMEKAAQLFIAYTEEHPNDPTGYINVGNILIQLKQIEEAERFFLKAILLDEKAATAFYGLGNLYFKEAMYEQAEKMFTKALSLGLQESDVYYMIGMTHLKQKNDILALPFLQRAVELDGEVEKLFQYGLLLAKSNYLDEAKKVFHNILKIKTSHADTLYNLGMIAIHQNDKNVALMYLEQAISANEHHTLAKNAIKQLQMNGMDGE